MPTNPSKFTNVKTALPPSDGFIPFVFNKLFNGEKLSRLEKNRTFHFMQSQKIGATEYKMEGWRFPFKQFMKPYVVKYPAGEKQIWAFDKTSIRKSFHTNSQLREITDLV